MRACRASIDTGALRHNLARVRELAPGSRVMAVIKANAYGHGLVPVARALEGADALAVARLEEAKVLRQAGTTGRIVLLEGVFHGAQLEEAARLDIELVVHGEEQLEFLEGWSGDHRFPVWLKIDTGMNRLGFRPDKYAAVARRLEACTAVAAGFPVMTHLANADDPDDPQTGRQLEQFAATVAERGGELCIANSAALLGWQASHVDWVRPGIMLYGVSPFLRGYGEELGLRPAMTLQSRIIALRIVEPGESVGYGSTWTASSPTRVGIAAIGYGDGYPRHLPSGTPVLVEGEACTLVGRVSMDMIAIDLGTQTGVQVGDEVILWGEGLPVERVARCAGTIPYELLCGITQRVSVDYTGADTAPS